MFIIVDRKSTAFDVRAHEEMVSKDVPFYKNIKTGEYAVFISGKFKHPYKPVEKLNGEGWQCQK